MWAFPGGKLDEEDYDGTSQSKNKKTAYKNAAVREVKEEIGIDIDKKKL